MNGAIILNKPEGITSQGAVNVIRKIFGTRKVGHTGTLDPMATGVLTVLVGSAVKASELLLSVNKSYTATLKLGITTDTQDVWGKVTSLYDKPLPSFDELKAVLDAFRGDILQTPPMYSALKRDGQKLCDLARKGVELELEPRPVCVYSLEAERCDTEGEYLLHVDCSKGTYIRTLCHDIGAALGCGGVMKSLCRASNGGFDISETVSLDELRASEAPEKYLIPTDKLFSRYPEIRLSAFYSKLARCGNEIYLSKLGIDAKAGDIFRTYDNDGVFFALTECREYEGGRALGNLRMFG